MRNGVSRKQEITRNRNAYEHVPKGVSHGRSLSFSGSQRIRGEWEFWVGPLWKATEVLNKIGFVEKGPATFGIEFKRITYNLLSSGCSGSDVRPTLQIPRRVAWYLNKRRLYKQDSGCSYIKCEMLRKRKHSSGRAFCACNHPMDERQHRQLCPPTICISKGKWSEKRR